MKLKHSKKKDEILNKNTQAQLKILFFSLSFLLLNAVWCHALTEETPYFTDLPDDGTREIATAAEAFRQHYQKSVDYTVNVSTPGFIRKSVNNTREFNAKEGKHIVVADYNYKWIDLGATMETGRPLDMVVDGDNRAFFTVQLHSDLIAYTRDGRFRVDFEGRLVTLAGNYPVLGKNGFITIEDQIDVEVSGTGGIYVNGAFVDHLLITVFENFEDMNRHLDNLSGTFFTLDKEIPIEEGFDKYKIMQYHSRQSNAFKAFDSWFYKQAHKGCVTGTYKLIETSRQLYNALAN